MTYIIYLIPIFAVLPIKFSTYNIHIVEVLILYILTIILFEKILVKKNEKLKIKKFLFYLSFYSGIFILLITISMLLNSNFGKDAIVQYLRFLIAIFFLINFRSIFKKIKINFFISSIIVASIVNSLYIILDYFYIHHFVDRAGDIILGGSVGYINAMVISLLLYKTFKVHFLNVFTSLILFINIFALILNGTRTWLLSSFIAIIFLFTINNISLKNIKGIILTIFITTIFFILYSSNIIDFLINTLFQNRSEELINIIHGNIENTSLSSRMAKWVLAYNLFIDKPIFGHGLMNIYLGLPEWLSDALNQRSDNQYLDLLTMLGGVPTLLILYYFIYIYKKIYKLYLIKYPYAKEMLLLLLTFFISSMFWATLYGYILYITIYIFTFLNAFIFNSLQGKK